MKSQRATFRSRPAHLSRAERHRRSASGAAVRPTRGSALGRGLGCAFATRRVAQFAATPRGGLQLVGARCIHRWRRTALTRRARMKPTEKGSVFATRRVARALTNRKSEWKAGPSPGSKFPIGSGESSPFRLFREATQLKTEGARMRIARIKSRSRVIYKFGRQSIACGRPAISAAPDEARSIRVNAVAAARGAPF